MWDTCRMTGIHCSSLKIAVRENWYSTIRLTAHYAVILVSLEYKVFGTNLTGLLGECTALANGGYVILYLILMLVWPSKWKANLLICTLVLFTRVS